MDRALGILVAISSRPHRRRPPALAIGADWATLSRGVTSVACGALGFGYNQQLSYESG